MARDELTAETVTDEEIRELRRLVVGDPLATSRFTDEVCHLVWIALDDGRFRHRTIHEARARCAALINARRKGPDQ